MTQYVIVNDRIFDLLDGSLQSTYPAYRRSGHDIWSAEAFVDAITDSSKTVTVRPYYFNDPIEDADFRRRKA